VPDLWQCVWGRRARLADLALLAQGGTYQADVHATGRVGCQGAADGGRLVVGVGETGQHPQSGHTLFPMCDVQVWVDCGAGACRSLEGTLGVGSVQ